MTDNTKTTITAELDAAELSSWYHLHEWLVTTKQGQALLTRFGLPWKHVGTCEAGGTPTYEMPALMLAIHEAQHDAWIARADAREADE